jgi:hypothetical protein
MVTAIASSPALAPAAGRAQQATGGGQLESAREEVRKAILEMEEFDLPMTATPAFTFTP